MRSPAVALPAEQYFADTAAKMSPGRTLPPRYARCSGSGVRARAFSSGCPNVLRDIGRAIWVYYFNGGVDTLLIFRYLGLVA
jgi:hypothetical protein